MSVTLFDRVSIPSKRTYTDEGFLIVPATIARTGVQLYAAQELGITDMAPTDIVRVYRPADEVFKPDSLNSFANKPITDNHPPELVSADNISKYSVGMSSHQVTRDGDFAKTTLHITHADAIKRVENGKTELSNGYTSDLQFKSGIAENGEAYDAIQTNIRGNHIAIVDRARAGRQCTIADTVKSKHDEGKKMATVNIDGVDFEVSDQAAQAVKKMQDTIEKMKAKKDTEKKELGDSLATVTKERDTLQAKLDDAQSKILTDSALDEHITARQTIIDNAKKVNSKIEWTGKSNADIKKAIVADACPTVKVDDVSSDYIDARFDMLVENASAKKPATKKPIIDAALNKQFEDAGDKDNRPAHVIAREKMIADSRNLWKKESK